MKNLIIKVFLLVTVFSLFLIGSEKTTVLVSIYRYDDMFMGFVKNDIKEYAKDKVNIFLRDSQNSQATQNDVIDIMIERGVNVLAVNLVNPRSAEAVIAKARKHDIPIVLFNKEPSKEDMDSYDKIWYVGTKSEQSGVLQGKIIHESWIDNPQYDKNKDGKIQYVMIQGEPNHADAIGRSVNSIKYLKDNNIGVDLLAQGEAFWDEDNANLMMKQYLRKYGDKIEYIISNNDSMAIGALNAIREFGYNKGDDNKFIPIVGVDGIPSVIDEISKGNIVGTVLQSPKNQAYAIVDLVSVLSKGGNPLELENIVFEDSKYVRLPYVAITSENINLAYEAYK